MTDRMQSLTSAGPETRSGDLLAENLDLLRALFPEAFTEGGIDFDVLRQLLGGAAGEREEKYGLNWHGKRQARQLALTPSAGTLLPRPDESVDWDTTQNLMIEGDNLEVLKLLHKSYAGKVKLIYIDPPYNTGSDFIYKDDFRDNLQSYLQQTEQVDAEGKRKGSNTERSGRFHSAWLSMMYPRLKLARTLLREDGFLFVSIDQGELGALRLMLDEIFGEENFVNVLSWVRTRTPAALSQKTKSVAEYLLCYERSRSDQPLLGIAKPTQSANTLLNQPNAVGTLVFPEGTETGIEDGLLAPGVYGSASYTVELLEPTEVRRGRFVRPVHLRARFRWSQQYLDEQIAAGTRIRIATPKLLPSYEKDSYGRESMPNLVDQAVGVGTNESAGTELESLLGSKVFDYPKPVSLLRYLVNSCTAGNDIILDFFAGSGTTAHAIMEQNAADGCQRRFILVQLDEPIDPASPAAEFCKTLGRPRAISEISKERLRRAGERIRQTVPAGSVDTGFRVYRLATSNIRRWSPDHENLDASLLENVDHLVEGRSEQDILTEILLRFGVDLTTPVERRVIAGKTVHGVGGGVLLVCLAERIEEKEVDSFVTGISEWVAALSPAGESRLVIRDAAFVSDVAKTNCVMALEHESSVIVRTI